MRITINKKAICNKHQMASGTNGSKSCSRRVCSRRVCSRRVLERFGGSASYL
jgi:hypothetical protein